MREIEVEELAEVVAAGGRVIDVREPQEYVEGHVPGAALMPMGAVPGRLEELPKGETVYVICARGSRSANVVGLLERNGYDAVNVAGGTHAWIDAGREVHTGA